ncbi:hypothetical protein A1OO_08665 [Enterovibrio norvegicus FF-33]|uniref:hypothetical protein n=1 Tax=Enterovibrio norvegicus TaxID=188144 RepID=UPI000377BEEA|nr:hypothetical protein [Enterovibrio norvegicus]OEE65871.1 hypothetical protein A1OO_08665 [Enterovibrio norvegicus FF-33]
MINRIVNLLKNFFKSSIKPKVEKPLLQPKCVDRTAPKAKDSEDASLCENFLKLLKNYNKDELPKGMILYHGTIELGTQTCVKSSLLAGTRKWFSEDKIYAANYAFANAGDNLGRRYLWKCRLKSNLAGIEGSQLKLSQKSPWKGEFPWKFPNHYHLYARKILGEKASYGFFNEYVNGIYQEVLVTEHNNVIEVIEVIELPDTKEKAIAFVSAKTDI